MELQTTRSSTARSSACALGAGILFALGALSQIFTLVGYLDYYLARMPLPLLLPFLVSWVPTFLSHLLLAVAFLRRKADLLPIAACALCAFLSLLGLVFGGLNALLLLRLLSFGANLAFFAVVALSLSDSEPPHRTIAKRCWFLPAALSLCVIVFSFLFRLIFGSGSVSLLYSLANTLGILFASLWAVGIGENEESPVESETDIGEGEEPDPSESDTAAPGAPLPQPSQDTAAEGYCGLFKHILLLLFTFGIWNLIWTWRMTDYLNRVEDEPPRNPTTKLLLYMFVPFYSIYWTYKSAQRVDKLSAQQGDFSDLGTLCLILAIFVPIIPPILMQDKINTLLQGTPSPRQETAREDADPEEPARKNCLDTALEVAEALKTYKELLDSGIITREEFDAKKKQLLSL